MSAKRLAADAIRGAMLPDDVHSAATNPSVQKNAAIIATNLITTLDTGRAVGALMLEMTPGTEANEAGVPAYPAMN